MKDLLLQFLLDYQIIFFEFVNQSGMENYYNKWIMYREVHYHCFFRDGPARIGVLFVKDTANVRKFPVCLWEGLRGLSAASYTDGFD